MDIFDFFKSSPKMSTDEVRTFLKGRDTEDVNLIDVRQLSEYEKEHLPGARLIPLGELRARLGELDPKKTTIVY